MSSFFTSDPLSMLRSEKKQEAAAKKAEPKKYGGSLRLDPNVDIAAKRSQTISAPAVAPVPKAAMLTKPPSQGDVPRTHHRSDSTRVLFGDDSEHIDSAGLPSRNRDRSAKVLSQPFRAPPPFPAYTREQTEFLADESELMPNQPLLPGDSILMEVKDVGFEREGFPYSLGVYSMTNYRLGFAFDAPILGQASIQVPNTMVEQIEQLQVFHAPAGKRRFRLTVITKDFRKFFVYFEDIATLSNACKMIELYCFSRLPTMDAVQRREASSMGAQPDEEEAHGEQKFEDMFCWAYAKKAQKSGIIFTREQNGWEFTSDLADYQRMGLPDADYELVNNEDFSICSTYPKHFLYPTKLRHELKDVAKYRSRKRLPALVWRDSAGVATLWRCAQPCAGMGPRRQRSAADEKLFQRISSVHNEQVTIIDCRPKANAVGNGAMGKGYENTDDYKNCRLFFCDIDNIHVVRDAAKALNSVLWGSGYNIDAPGVDSTRWLQQLKAILLTVFKTVQFMDQDKGSVVIHCSDGWDRTGQTSALAQICLDPHYRTSIGFMTLIQREFCNFGHQFHTRSGHLSEDAKQDQRAPIFLMFLDCVYQLLEQFPSHFQFNSALLVELAHATYSCRFGTFAFNHVKQREENKGTEKTISVWTYLLGSPAAQRGDWLNPLYSPDGLGGYKGSNSNNMTFPTGRVLYPHWNNLKIWGDFWLKHMVVPFHPNHKTERVTEASTLSLGNSALPRRIPDTAALPRLLSNDHLYLPLIAQLLQENAELKKRLSILDFDLRGPNLASVVVNQTFLATSVPAPPANQPNIAPGDDTSLPQIASSAMDTETVEERPHLADSTLEAVLLGCLPFLSIFFLHIR
jgi:hypothetical protein